MIQTCRLMKARPRLIGWLVLGCGLGLLALQGQAVRQRLALLLLSGGKPLSQNKLAELTGISKKDMSLYLNGSKPVSAAIRTQIVQVLEDFEKQGNTIAKQAETDLATETGAETLLTALDPETTNAP